MNTRTAVALWSTPKRWLRERKENKTVWNWRSMRKRETQTDGNDYGFGFRLRGGGGRLKNTKSIRNHCQVEEQEEGEEREKTKFFEQKL